jgi:sulfur-carrier protein adenylyltransferase/sulfurtransferase
MNAPHQDLYKNSFNRNYGVITREEQEKLRNAKVTVVGAGGVGGITLIQLARMGVGAIHVIDRDEFEASNINRQMLSSVSKLGSRKAEVAAEVLRDINPEISVRTSIEFVTEDNATALLANSDVVIDATDNLVSRVVVHRAAAQVGAPSVWIAVTPPFRGGVMSLTPTSKPYELVLRHPSYQKELTPEVRDQVSALKDARADYSVAQGALPEWRDAYLKREAPWAVLAPVANIVGVLASFEAFKFIVKRPGLLPVIGPRLVKVDLSREHMVQAIEPGGGDWDNATL